MMWWDLYVRRIRYDLIRTCVIAISGYKKRTAPAEKIQDLEFNLHPVAFLNDILDNLV